MAEIHLQDGENIDAALRRFKKEVIKHAIIAEIKRREHFENPKAKRKRKKEEGRVKAALTRRFKKDRF